MTRIRRRPHKKSPSWAKIRKMAYGGWRVSVYDITQLGVVLVIDDIPTWTDAMTATCAYFGGEYKKAVKK